MVEKDTTPETPVPSSRADSITLPDLLPIFPLEGALLLPGGELPLNVFEPRYLAMVDHALATDRMIGMIQPRTKEQVRADDHPALYTVGCAGRIIAFAESGDGRYMITLKGICRFDVVEEAPPLDGFRRVVANYQPYANDGDGDNSGDDDDGADAAIGDVEPGDRALGSRMNTAPRTALSIDRDSLLKTLAAYLQRLDLSADWEAIRATPTDELVSVMAMLCPFVPSEKQALLEAATPMERRDLIMSLMTMAGLDQRPDDDEDWRPSSH